MRSEARSNEPGSALRLPSCSGKCSRQTMGGAQGDGWPGTTHDPRGCTPGGPRCQGGPWRRACVNRRWPPGADGNESRGVPVRRDSSRIHIACSLTLVSRKVARPSGGSATRAPRASTRTRCGVSFGPRPSAWSADLLLIALHAAEQGVPVLLSVCRSDDPCRDEASVADGVRRQFLENRVL